MSGVTSILNNPESGDSMPEIYRELRGIAAQKMANEAPGHTLQPTALVNEAWLRLAGSGGGRWNSRGHFFSAAAEAMRRILIESARRKKRLKHGGDLERAELDNLELPMPLPDDQLLALDEALDRLAVARPDAAEVVKLCFFVGLTQKQAADELQISRATAERLWSFARAWLFHQIQKDLLSGSLEN
jgi:RNA polymerase sigma factor (TIGR02999 family)